MEKIYEKHLTGERALFKQENTEIYYSTFSDGESPLKESSNIIIDIVYSSITIARKICFSF